MVPNIDVFLFSYGRGGVPIFKAIVEESWPSGLIWREIDDFPISFNGTKCNLETCSCKHSFFLTQQSATGRPQDYCLIFDFPRIASEIEGTSSSFFADKLATVRSFMASFSSFFFSASASFSFSSRDLLNIFTKTARICVTAIQKYKVQMLQSNGFVSVLKKS
ncbi:hypothetical protein PanWU01x14_339010 [Parasponia andersonii]|uniref:Uncharacterized protein n=1 Tax=Parasponia andersonii TaxID=3476 RepID=A0A2P5AEW8_PARAD|nr:hypothetical protein PanWU01x14_339010 [Parasponia andersonii]